MTAPDATQARGDVMDFEWLIEHIQRVEEGSADWGLEDLAIAGRVAAYASALTAERDALSARVQACEVDAARYQWLKARNAGLVCAIAYKVKDACAFDNPDDAIDAAIRATVIPRGQ